MSGWSISSLLGGLHDDISRRLALVREGLAHPGTKGDGIPQTCRIRFDRHASGPQGVFLEEKSPIPSEVWSLEPRADGKNCVVG